MDKSRKQQFLTFVESLKTKENSSLLEAVGEAFKVCLEDGWKPFSSLIDDQIFDIIENNSLVDVNDSSYNKDVIFRKLPELYKKYPEKFKKVFENDPIWLIKFPKEMYEHLSKQFPVEFEEFAKSNGWEPPYNSMNPEWNRM